MRRAWIVLDEDDSTPDLPKRHEITFEPPRYPLGRVVEIVYAEVEEGEPK